MARIIFIHGTGVRQTAFDTTFKLFSLKMSKIRSHSVEPCYWGGAAGASLLAGGRSIPARSVAEAEPTIGKSGNPTSAVDEETLWAALEISPLIELQQISEHRSRIRYARRESEVIVTYQQRFEKLFECKPVSEAMMDAGLSDVEQDALTSLLSTSEFRAAAASTAVDDASKIGAMARAYVAVALTTADQKNQEPSPVDGVHRDRLVLAIIEALGGEARGGGRVLASAAYKMAVGLGVLNMVERKRTVLTASAVPQAGDTLKYLVRGEALKSFVKSCVYSSPEPVIVVAHSLGAIASIELLSNGELRQVTQLITVGTQVGLLYELDALPGLPFPSELPASMPEWHNIIDRRDFLAYATEGLFPGAVEDHYIDNRAPFPRNHSAYFGNDDFYELTDRLMF